jgi:hypothetical protein
MVVGRVHEGQCLAVRGCFVDGHGAIGVGAPLDLAAQFSLSFIRGERRSDQGRTAEGRWQKPITSREASKKYGTRTDTVQINNLISLSAGGERQATSASLKARFYFTRCGLFGPAS